MSGTFIQQDPEEQAEMRDTLMVNFNLTSQGTFIETSSGSGGQQQAAGKPPRDSSTFIENAPNPSSSAAAGGGKRKPTFLKKSPKSFNFNRTRQGSAPSAEDVSTVHSRRGEVSAEVLTALKRNQYQKVAGKKTAVERKLIRNVVDVNPLFKHLSELEKDECVDAMERRDAVLDELLIEEGDQGDLFFVLEEGTCDVLKMRPGDESVVGSGGGGGAGMPEGGQQDVVNSYKPPAGFGELALLYNEPRQASVKVTSAKGAKLWVIDRKTYKYIQVQYKILRSQLYEENLKRLEFMKHLSSEETSRVLDTVEEERFEPGEVIMKEGERGDKLYIILDGEVTYTQREKGIVGRSMKGEFFGEAALSKDETRAATVTTNSKVLCMTLTRQKLEESVGSMDQIIKAARPVSVAIATKDLNHKYHIAMKYEDLDTMVGRTNPGGGGKSGALLGGGRAYPATSVSDVASAASSINSDGAAAAGKQPPPSSGKHLLEKTGQSTRHFFPDAITEENVPAASGPEKGEIVLGVGTFGKVILVKHKLTHKTYAMKRLNKSWIVDNSLEQHVIDERNVMTLTDHPFILKLHNSYWSDRYIYFVLELCLGGELFTYLRRLGHFTEQQSRFYAGSIVEAFDHLHGKSIVYRDLKPENIMLDAEGFVKLVDFGLAKVVRNRTWTLCGTPEYLAPEIILGKGHNKAVDYWALGVLIYELVTGYVPFSGDDNMAIFQKILGNVITFPNSMTPSCKEIIRGFMRTSQLSRLGNTRLGVNLIRDHPWFVGYEFAALVQKKIPPPIAPNKVANAEDVSNFEVYTAETEEEEAPVCNWRPTFPYEIYEGKTLLFARRVELE